MRIHSIIRTKSQNQSIDQCVKSHSFAVIQSLSASQLRPSQSRNLCYFHQSTHSNQLRKQCTNSRFTQLSNSSLRRQSFDRSARSFSTAPHFDSTKQRTN